MISRIRQDTGCSVVAIRKGGKLIINPNPLEPIAKESEMILVGTYDNERQFFRSYLKK